MTWGYAFAASDLDLRSRRRSIFYGFDFEACDEAEARRKTLELFQRSIRRLRSCRDRHIHFIAAPYFPGGKVKDATRMIRPRDSYSNRRVLRIKNPDVAFVYGYGSQQVDQLSR